MFLGSTEENKKLYPPGFYIYERSRRDLQGAVFRFSGRGVGAPPGAVESPIGLTWGECRNGDFSKFRTCTLENFAWRAYLWAPLAMLGPHGARRGVAPRYGGPSIFALYKSM